LEIRRFRKPLLWLGALVFTAAAVPQIFGAVTAYGNSKRDAATFARDLSDQAVASISSQVNSIRILVFGLTPAAQLSIRCQNNQLPPHIDVVKVCSDAPRDEIVEEQQEKLTLDRSVLDGVALGRRLGHLLEDKGAAVGFVSLRESVEALGQLEASTLCDGDRQKRVERLSVPNKGFSNREWANEKLRADLFGLPSANGRCDNHGNDFPGSVDLATDSLQHESDAVAARIMRSKIYGVDDRPWDLWFSMFNATTLITLALAGAIYFAGKRIPEKSDEVDVVD